MNVPIDFVLDSTNERISRSLFVLSKAKS